MRRFFEAVARALRGRRELAVAAATAIIAALIAGGQATLAAIAATGADICGENGEYHTLVTGGPLFRHPLPVRPGPVIHFGTHAAMDFLLP